MKIAITREVSPAIERCELTYVSRAPIDAALAAAQHASYERALEAAGYTLRRLPPAPGLPDAVFVEDTALVLDEIAVITRPGAASRRAETDSTAMLLAEYRPLLNLSAGTLDGGDVLRLDRTLYVGLSARSSRAGIEALAQGLRPYGYRVEAVPFSGCLHLKSAVTQVGPETLLLNPDWVEPRHFPAMNTIEVDPAEPHAANALWLGGMTIYPESWPLTGARIERAGGRLVRVDMSETEKAEGGVTCCSLLLDA